jgi:diamine N-acetyltransferase
MKIKEAKRKDLNEICNLFIDIDKMHVIAHPNIFQYSQDVFQARKKNLSDKLSNTKNIKIFIVIHQQEIIGFATVLIKESKSSFPTLKKRKYGYIEDIYVKDNHRRKGIAKKILDHCETWIKSKHINEVELGVFSFNKGAINLYIKNNYTLQLLKMYKKLEK